MLEGARRAMAEAASSGAAAAPPTSSAEASSELREAVAATLGAVRQLEAAMSQRMDALLASGSGSRPAGAAATGKVLSDVQPYVRFQGMSVSARAMSAGH